LVDRWIFGQRIEDEEFARYDGEDRAIDVAG
jgi:hypothetical protein